MVFNLCLIFVTVFVLGSGVNGKSDIGSSLPQHFRWSQVGSQSIQLSWDDHKVNGHTPDQVHLFVIPRSSSLQRVEKQVAFSAKTVILEGLHPNTLYYVILTVSAGEEEVLNHIGTIRTKKYVYKMTPLPQHFRWSNVGPQSVRLSWDKHTLDGYTPTLVVMTLKSRKPDEFVVEKFGDFNVGSVTLGGLQPDTVYDWEMSVLWGQLILMNRLGEIKTSKAGAGGVTKA
ncbi:unnamed protein product [Hydatigera taeniaeformis]|uniref:Fibronectin type-III domain-containing protein n=1 Tax=Hydatigena taeniaeformis TaxID=6205 RepID=A0A0R3WMH8_HYDTA|nr:unnamed protein product [Hydatigera taeniaeformis]